MKFYWEKSITCPVNPELGNKGKNCGKLYEHKIKELLDTEDQTQFHLSIYHGTPHKFWLFLYNQNGKHESDQKGKTVIRNISTIKKFKGTMPTQKQLEKL